MRHFLIDTDVISQFVRRKPHPAVLSWIDQIARDGLSVCAITAAELVSGVERLRRENLTAATDLALRIRRLLDSYRDSFLPIGVAEAELLGAMYATPALRNFVTGGTTAKPKTGADLIIAACAIVNGRTIATGNVAHFAEIHRHFALPGLFDPFKGEWAVQNP